MKLIPLTNGGFAFIDDEDFESVSKMKWFRNSKGYIQSTKGTAVLLHRVVMKAPKGVQVDHTYHRLEDNRKFKLRFCNYVENQMNQVIRTTNYDGKPKVSMYKGVYRSGKKWGARISVEGKLTHLGTFPTDKVAALAYNQAATLHFGEFAYLNTVEIPT